MITSEKYQSLKSLINHSIKSGSPVVFWAPPEGEQGIFWGDGELNNDLSFEFFPSETSSCGSISFSPQNIKWAKNIIEIEFPKDLQNKLKNSRLIDWESHLRPSQCSSTKKTTYLQNIQHAKSWCQALASERKVVLSRLKQVPYPKEFHPLDLFLRLFQESAKRLCYLFYSPTSGLWIGASPEILLNKNGLEHHTTALASTLPFTSIDQKPDWSPKEWKEQEMVAKHIRETIEQVKAVPFISVGPYNFSAGPVWHLKTDFQFQSTNQEVIKLLHPTPAVVGLPVKEALEKIKSMEKHDRLYYTGYLGIHKNESESQFWVNLRCMQLFNKQVSLYLGGGITADSDPAQEWQETEWKANSLLKHFLPLGSLIDE